MSRSPALRSPAALLLAAFLPLAAPAARAQEEPGSAASLRSGEEDALVRPPEHTPEPYDDERAVPAESATGTVLRLHDAPPLRLLGGAASEPTGAPAPPPGDPPPTPAPASVATPGPTPSASSSQPERPLVDPVPGSGGWQPGTSLAAWELGCLRDTRDDLRQAGEPEARGAHACAWPLPRAVSPHGGGEPVGDFSWRWCSPP